MIRPPPKSTPLYSSAASDVYKRQLKIYFEWYFGNKKYSDKKQDEKLKYTIFTHKTPLYRELKDVDMWLQDNKINNLKIAVPKINKILIRPGETFSYWKLI